ncbi:bifunctional 5,10-methylenetetrahydrofolate dehydrogenase/5,10-methenyltetrahydrofolate cyclohydrolase [Candidatus Dojkabacteria bacterium]|uniref:Bifunctional protein FolD n=1 Tax=Candidatus Dojkabacteria bacterium TaxID=2099670 RepID=A0A955KYT2_9BACT|nr:bifunctional 5,10-methylenetetrahydrofolate dehydrogenase/5,10-methenyltetrahydrofolate cyclohydrolase [Candidatus Dojkabacteria bacterium]
MLEDQVQKIDGVQLSTYIYTGVTAMLGKLGRQPKLAIILATTDEPSHRYVELKRAAAGKLGIAVDIYDLPAEKQAPEVIDLIKQLNADYTVDGIIVQLPMYPHLEHERKLIINAVAPNKDVDGLTALNQGYLSQNYFHYFVPAAVKAIMFCIQQAYSARNSQELRNQLQGKHVAIISQSVLVGRPLAQVLMNYDATVTLANGQTPYLPSKTKTAQIVVSATGTPGLITADHLQERAIVIDAGSTKTDSGVRGDLLVNQSTLSKMSAFTPVPGGVGPLTIAFLLDNLVKAASTKAGS